jgi:phage gp29-like protein
MGKLKQAWKVLRGKSVASPIATRVGEGPIAAGMLQLGESNLVDPPSAPGAAPAPGTIVKAQVAERWITSVTRNLAPETVAAYLDEAVSGTLWDQFALFEEMEEKWPELRLALYKHKLKASRRTPRIVPPDQPQDAGLAKRKADFANYVFGGMLHWHRTAFNLLDAVGKGISGAEIDWRADTVKGQPATVIHQMPWVYYRHWGYWWDKPEIQLFPDLLDLAYHIDVPDRKFVVFHHLSKSGHPSRAALLRPLAWYFLIYLFAMKDWASLAETFGIDVAHAFCNKDSTQEQRGAILLHLSRMAARAGVFDEGTVVELQRAAGGGEPPQQALVQYCSSKALELLLGATLPTQAGEHGARSLGLVHQDETEEVVDWTCLLLAGTISGTALRWLMEFNFAEPGDNPVLELPGANRRDIAALAGVLNVLAGLGLRIPEAWAHAQFDIPQPKELDELDPETGAGEVERMLTPGPSRAPAATGAGALQAREAQAAIEAIRARAVVQGSDMRVFDQLAGPIKRLITGVEPEQALADFRKESARIGPAALRGAGREMLVLADLITRFGVDRQPEGQA